MNIEQYDNMKHYADYFRDNYMTVPKYDKSIRNKKRKIGKKQSRTECYMWVVVVLIIVFLFLYLIPDHQNN